jgi:hypothetical protein
MATLGAAGIARAQSCDIWNPPPVTDTPDAAFTDANGDGIDGMRCGPIFVCVDGNDANAGTIDAPMRTVNAAILAAWQMTPKRDVYVSSNGEYNETLWVMSGVNVYGGFDHAAGWGRSNKRAVVRGGAVAAWADNIYQPTRLDSLAIFAAGNPAPGGHSIGLMARNGGALITIANGEVHGGAGGAGVDGAPGTRGVDGQSGQSGGQGSCDGNGPGAPGGAPGGGASRGGEGGRGGPSSGTGNGYGGASGSGPGGGAGGSGGKGGNPGRQGTAGQDGAPGNAGPNGGGGGGQVCTFCDDGQGNGGGGGGGGGWRGEPGRGGTFGGSSYAVVIRGAAVLAEDSWLEAGPGGRGGNGGAGGFGGVGGSGGGWFFTCNNEVGMGSFGGRGGNGGNGGSGGGGAGGSSVAVLLESGNAYQTRGLWVGGTAGAGGRVGGGNNGVSGITAAFNQPPAWVPLPGVFAPVATHGRMTVPANSGPSYKSPLLADPEPPQTYSLELLSQPGNGTASAVSFGVTYQPNAGFQGWDAFRYRVMDPVSGGPVEGWMSVFVTPPPLSAADVARALRLAGGLSPWSAGDERLDAIADGRIGVDDAVTIMRSVYRK